MRQLYKIVIVGDGGVGKTTTIHNIFHYLQKKFPTVSYKSSQEGGDTDTTSIARTKFIDFHSICFTIHDQKVTWQIWDLQGQRFPSANAYTSLNPLDHITETIVNHSDLILLTFDSSNNATYNELFREKGFFDLIRPHLTQQQSVLLLASKTDLLESATKDPIAKMQTEYDFETVSFNNVYLENISLLSETILSLLQLPEGNQTIASPHDEPVSLKVYR